MGARAPKTQGNTKLIGVVTGTVQSRRDLVYLHAIWSGPRFCIHMQKELTMKKLNETRKAKLKLSRETVTVLSTTVLGHVQGGGTTVTKGIGCEPSGIIACQ